MKWPQFSQLIRICSSGGLSKVSQVMICIIYIKGSIDLNKHKPIKLAVEQYISNAPNKCRAAWKMIKDEHSPTHSQYVNLDPDELNSYSLNSL